MLESRSQVVIVLISLSFGLWFITPQNVWPTSTEWLRYGDMEFSQYMWEYFRYTPVLQWPITEVAAAGDGWGLTTYSTLLLSVPFKLFSSLLPENFQFFGMWTLANFGLQGFFAERLFCRLGLREIERVLGAVSILIAPVFIFRIQMTHLDLAAQWLILAALLIYVGEDNPHLGRKVCLLNVLSLLVHLYLFIMVFLIALAALARPLVANSHNLDKLWRFVRQAGSLGAVSIVTFWLSGYLSYQDSSRGVGFFRLNAMAFFNPRYLPSGSFSQTLDKVPIFTGRTFFVYEGEGFAYLGSVGILGVLALLLSLRKWGNRQNWRLFAPLVSVAAVLFAIAISDRVAIVRREVQLPIPQMLIDARQIFRAATRFSWVAYYLLLVLGWIAICQVARRARVTMIALPIILAVGVVDQWAGMKNSRDTILGERRQSSLQSVEWENFTDAATNMFLVPTFDLQSDESSPITEVWLTNYRWADVIAYGAGHRLVTNFAYSPRPVTRQVESANTQLSEMLQQGQIPRKSILFFALESDWLAASKSVQLGDISKQLDGYFIIVTKE